MSAGRLRIAVVGHVDHGKSTLIGQILRSCRPVAGDLAHVTDQLVEERAGAFTMDTAQAFCRINGRELVLVDVPGHRDLLRHMMTGATRADVAILVVAADEGVREQTRRHAALLGMLGFGAVTVVVNKMDAVGYSNERFDQLCGDARDVLARARCPEPSAMIPVSATLGCNVATPSAEMPWYLGPTLLETIGDLSVAPRDPGPARFIVQTILPIDGTTAHAGRLLDGTIRRGDSLICQPAGTRVRVEHIVRFPEDDRPMGPGESAALSLSGDSSVERGCVLAAADAEQPRVGTSCAVRVFWLDSRPLRAGERLTVRFATQEAECVATAINRRIDSDALVERGAGEIRETDVADLILATDRPVVTEPFRRVSALGRFVLERDGVVAGAGVVPG